MNFWLNHVTPLLIPVEYAILTILIVLGIACSVLFCWRIRILSKARGTPEKWVTLLCAEGEISRNTDAISGEQSVPARLVRTGFANMEKVPAALEKILDAQEMAEKRQLEKGASFLGTVGANAPFIGLTGTVLGILAAFQRFADAGGHGSADVMSAISRSLVATALGLLVAIPAVIFYNTIRGKIRSIIDQGRELRALFIARSIQASVNRKEP